MKRKKTAKWILFGAAVVFTAALTGLGVYKAAAGRRPFAALCAEDIAGAQVELSPPGRRFALGRDAIGELCGILRVATVYQKDGSWGEYAGQKAVYTLSFRDGSTVRVTACPPFLVLDGVGFYARYEPCGALLALAREQAGP